MILLAIEDVSKSYCRGRREYVALKRVSMTVESGEVVAVLGSGKSGRSTLLRIAAGLERPDSGRVIFQGLEMPAGSEPVGRRVAFVHHSFDALQGDLVVDQVAAPLLAQQVSLAQARRRAGQMLERCGAADCADLEPFELDTPERVRVVLARALIVSPVLLVIDEPTAGLGLLESDPLLKLLHSVAEEGIAVLLATGDPTSLSGVGRWLRIEAGAVRGETRPRQADVLPFPQRRLSADPGM